MTICAIVTAPGGAVAIVRVSGPEAIAAADKIFRGRQPLSAARGFTAHYGTIAEPGGTVIDDVIATVFRAPHSYTGEDSVEFSCHASPYILTRVCSLLIAGGCRQAEPGEYTRRAYLNGKLDLTRAEAVADLIAAQTEAQHRVAMTQMRGGITARLRQLRDKLLNMTSLLELELDFSEEDVEFADRAELRTLAADIAAEIERLTASFADGDAIRRGVPVAIVGAPNVGKSTLLNALLGDDRAIVSDISGTTRDIVSDTLTIAGTLFRIIDTAGLRHTADRIEQLGIERTRRAASEAHIIIMLTEPGVPFPDIATRRDQHVIRITNKTPEFQARTGIGLDTLRQQLAAAAPQATPGTVLITSLRHKAALDAALADIRRAAEGLNTDVPSDLVAEDLRTCLAHLADILGSAITPTEVLNNIFKNFCIGK